jgi:uncharacterized protein YecT (DUF1311 family)
VNWKTSTSALACIAAAVFGAVPAVSSTPESTSGAAEITSCLANRDANNEPAETCIGVIAGPCLDGDASSTFAMAECFTKEADAWDEILNERYTQILSASAPAVGRAVRDAQRSWVTTRQRSCSIYAVQREAGETGSMATISAAECWRTETARRAIFLGQLGES